VNLNSEMDTSKSMSKAKQIDDLIPEEIKDIDEFYANDDDKKTLSFDEFMKELKESS